MTKDTAIDLIRSSGLDIVADEDYRDMGHNLSELVTSSLEEIADFDNYLGMRR
jgi:hypothetical protein